MAAKKIHTDVIEPYQTRFINSLQKASYEVIQFQKQELYN